ncbi:DUF1697 domain-containing protein [Asticcacaulis sp. EMRT-3]|uniref:DUF1697 domain-containing protein n=1 Tax=Asticcacaulis sp. EMRT-3 TaxID=3040349 RepID=UPI0024AF1B86|nr:DUF1697 domain-containing protein [Asticcacaulis sp. EMRT-3]MDI7774394.1 DUF1697 domain-containing protein [Asticcacaulis sp. EMRT-3]
MQDALWIGLFRGVNVGGNNKLPMKDLKTLMESEGFTEVKTYIQSGNMVFRSSLSEAETTERIEAAIAKRFGFRPPLFLVTRDHLEKLLADNPFRNHEHQGKAQHFFFLKAPPAAADLDALSALKANGEDFKLTDEVFYLYAPEGIGRSKLAEKIGRYIKADMTARNLNTVETLVEMAKGEK